MWKKKHLCKKILSKILYFLVITSTNFKIKYKFIINILNEIKIGIFYWKFTKKNERITVSDNSSTDFLKEKIFEGLRAKKSSLSIKYKKDGIYVFYNNYIYPG